MAATLQESLKQALFCTKAEEIAFTFGWNAATVAAEEKFTSTNKPSTTCLLCGHMEVCYFYKHSGGGCCGMFVPRTSHVG